MSVFVIAEAGVNHNGSLDLACQLVDVAADCGADAVKFQTFKAGSLVSKHAAKAEYQKKTTGSAESQLEMIRKLELGADDHRKLLERCRARKIEFMSSPFDLDSLEFLVSDLNVGRIKLGSGEITNAPLLLAAARTGRPVIFSTGMSTLADVEAALGVLAFGYTRQNARPSLSAFREAYASDAGYKALRAQVSLLHCTTEYPAPFGEVNLKAIETLSQAFGLNVGFSDHTPGIAIPIAATALGATVIEKHFTLDRGMKGPDHAASLEPAELKAMVQAIRQTQAALGTTRKLPAPSEAKNTEIARKSLVARRPIRSGEAFDEGNLTTKRPGSGVSPLLYWDYLGKRAPRDFAEDELVSL